MWRKQLTGVIALVAGVVLLAGGIVAHLFAAPKAALCDSGIGQIGQAFDNTVAHDCGLVTALESAVGWLIVAGILAVLLGIAVLVNSRLAYRPAAPMPGAAPMPAVPPRPATPPAPQTPPSAPADRPWWEQT
jgi:predicted acyltransferase